MTFFFFTNEGKKQVFVIEEVQRSIIKFDDLEKTQLLGKKIKIKGQHFVSSQNLALSL